MTDNPNKDALFTAEAIGVIIFLAAVTYLVWVVVNKSWDKTPWHNESDRIGRFMASGVAQSD